ncbi:hypothetical protein [Massilia sp. TN1-12]|uniref:hypothetical protein n=1 Tax=Massilia paldalensis TaxID=3377675 RepID=UPI00384FFB50
MRKARRVIERRDPGGICLAIGQVAGRKYREQGNRLIEWVGKMLDGHLYYSWWLRQHHPDVYAKVWETWQMTGRRGSPWRGGRLAWLDWMIAECEKEEAVHG